MLLDIKIYLNEVSFELISIFIVQIQCKELNFVYTANKDALLRECSSF